MRMVPELLRGLLSVLPHWAVLPVLAALAVVVAPSWHNWVKVKQVKNRLRWAARARTPEEREAQGNDAFTVANGRWRRLVALADEALKLNQRDLFRRALDELRASGKAPLDVQRLEAAVQPETPKYKHPVEAAVAIERLLKAGLYDRATERLSEALTRFPTDPDLLALRARLADHPPTA